MTSAAIALIILCLMIVSFVIGKIPISLTAMLAAIAMGCFGVIEWTDVFSGMSSSIVIFLVGCGVLGASYFSTGLSDVIGNTILRLGDRLTEKRLILLLYIVGAITSAFFNGVMIVAVLFPIIDALAKTSGGRISRKQLYLPTAISTVIGSNITIIGSTSMMLAVGLLAASEYQYSLSFFEPLLVGLPGVLAVFLVYATFGVRMQSRIFTFPDIPADGEVNLSEAASEKLTPRQWITILTTLACIGAMIAGFHYGAAGFLAASILVITGCVDIDRAYKSVSWNCVFLVVGSLGVAKGIQVSGAGNLVAETILWIFASFGDSPAMMCVVMLFIATLLSNFMSNGAAVSIVTPIALSLAQSLGTSGVPFVLAVAVGANISLATPICVTQVTMSCTAGYRFKDLLQMGGFLNLLVFAVTALALLLGYYL